MRALKICLWIAGLGYLSSVFGLFLPVSWLESLSKTFGGQEFPFPDSAVFLYTLRVVSGMSVVPGVFYIILALQPMNYGVQEPFSGLASVFLGVVCGIAGLLAGMPLWWFLGDFLYCTVVGILIVVFWRQENRIVELSQAVKDK